MKLFTVVCISNTGFEIAVKHVMATDANAAAAMVAEDADLKFIALFPGWQESLLATYGPPRESTDLLWQADNDEDDDDEDDFDD